ncbi:MAG: Sporulation protein [Variovorax sp.]|nr:Sporulation protein [Variovorax sp.]
MAFFKFRARGPQGAEGRPAATVPPESIEAMRRRARHRLVGAAVLVLLGVIGFPLLFDTQPRPVPVDIPIEIPDRNKTKPLAVPATPAPPAAVSSGSGKDARVDRDAAVNKMITETPDGMEIESALPVPEPAPRVALKSESKPASKPEPKPASKSEHKPEPKSESKAETKTARKPEPKPEIKAEATRTEPKAEAKAEVKQAVSKPEAKPVAPKPATSANDGARARALLDGKPSESTTAAASGEEAGRRFAIQVGAFADSDKARETRQKLESAGLKTYTHVAKTADGERTRVRVGPFASRAEADRAASRIKGLSLPAAVMNF